MRWRLGSTGIAGHTRYDVELTALRQLPMIPFDLTNDQTLQMQTNQKQEATATEQRNKQLVSKKMETRSTQSDGLLSRADGYAEGKRYFQRGLKPSTFLKVGLDEYARGFRAGYYLRVRLVNQAGLAGFETRLDDLNSV